MRRRSTANGTVFGSEFTTGVSDSRPFGATVNTSRAFVEAFVVTMTCEPSGVNAICPGVCVNCDVSVGVAGPRRRTDPSIG